VAIAEIRAGLAANISNTIPGLRVSAEVPDNPSPPIAVLSLNSITYDLDFNRGMTVYNFTVTLIVGRVAERDAQRKLDAYAGAGERSIKTAVQSDRTLGGAAFDCRLSEMNTIGGVTINEVTYVAADFAVQVYSE
jgi:hypothetical protein